MNWMFDKKYASPALIFTAHPDDEIAIAGTIAKMSEAGCEVHIFLATNGSAGRNADKFNRVDEFLKSCEILGAKPVIAWEENKMYKSMDGNVSYHDENLRDAMISVIQKIKPKICFIAYHRDPHNDHRMVSKSAAYSIFRASVKSNSDTHSVDFVFQYPLRQHLDFENVAIDISDFMEHKMNALKAHSSQQIDELKFVENRTEKFKIINPVEIL